MENDKGMNEITKSIISCSDCEYHDWLESSKEQGRRYSFCKQSEQIIKEHPSYQERTVLGDNIYIPDDCPLLKNPCV